LLFFSGFRFPSLFFAVAAFFSLAIAALSFAASAFFFFLAFANFQF
jgi:hypothetical protein